MQNIQDLINIIQEKFMDAEYYFAENDEYPDQIDVDSDFFIALENIIAALKELKQYRDKDDANLLSSDKKCNIIEKLPLLATYPIGLEDDIYLEDIEKVYKWEIETVKKLLDKLEHQYKGKHITFNAYSDFFNKEIKPYKEYFMDDYDFDGRLYEKILPNIISMYWSYRIDKTVNWSESWKLNNIGISIISILEDEYLNKNKRIKDYEYLIGEDEYE